MAAVTLTRHPDGRHALLDAEGNLLGLHNSLASAQRQVQDYYPEVAVDQASANQAQAKAKQSSGPGQQAAVKGTMQQGGIPVPQGGGQMQAMQGALQGQQPGGMAPMAPHPLDTLGTSQHNPLAMAAGQFAAPQIGTAAHTPTPQDLAAGMRYGQAVMQGKANFPMGRMP